MRSGQRMARAIPTMFFVLALAPVAHGQTSASEPLTLRAAVARALEHAPSLAVSRHAVVEAVAESHGAASAFSPDASISTTPGYSTGIPVAIAGRVPAIFSVGARQLIYDARTRGEVHLAEAKAEEATGALGRSRAETVRAVVILYTRCWANESLLSASKTRVESEESESTRIAALEREGRMTPLEAEKALLALARARQKLLDDTSGRDLDQRELRRLVAWPANETLVLADDPLTALPEASSGDDLAAARAADPELASLLREETLSTLAARMISRPLQPTVAAEAQYSRLTRLNNYDDYFKTYKADDFSIGVSISIPLFTGGRHDSGVQRAQAMLERVRAERVRREDALAGAVLKAEAAQTSAVAARSLAERARAVAAEGLRIARLLTTEGRGAAEGVAQASRALAEGDEELATATLRLVSARADLLSLRGELSGRLAP